MTYRRKPKIKEQPATPLCAQCQVNRSKPNDKLCVSCATHRDRGLEKAKKFPGQRSTPARPR